MFPAPGMLPSDSLGDIAGLGGGDGGGGGGVGFGSTPTGLRMRVKRRSIDMVDLQDEEARTDRNDTDMYDEEAKQKIVVDFLQGIFNVLGFLFSRVMMNILQAYHRARLEIPHLLGHPQLYLCFLCGGDHLVSHRLQLGRPDPRVLFLL